MLRVHCETRGSCCRADLPGPGHPAGSSASSPGFRRANRAPVSISAGESSSAVGCRAGDVWLYRSQHSPLLSTLLPSRPVCPSQHHVGPSLPRSLFPGLPGVTLYSCGHSRKPSPGPELWPFTLTLEVVGFFTFLFSLFTFYFVLGYSQLTNNTSLVAQTVKRLPAMRETQI